MKDKKENKGIFAEESCVDVVVGARKISLRGAGSKEYLKEISSYVNEKIGEIETALPKLKDDREKILILVCLNLADELFKQGYSAREGSGVVPDMENIKKRINGIIDSIALNT